MAVAFDAGGTKQVNITASATISIPITLGAISSGLVVVCITMPSASDTVSTVTWGGTGTFSKVTNLTWNTNDQIELWRAISASTSGAQTVTVTLNQVDALGYSA